MEIRNHHKGLLTIKDDADIDISQSKWDFIFEYSCVKDYDLYFIGWRLDFIHRIEIKNNLDSFISELSFKTFIDIDNHAKLLFKAKRLDRKILNELWQFYEYPSLFFLKNSCDEATLIATFNNNSKRIRVENAFCHLYKMDPELDVLWIEKSFDVNIFGI